MIIEVVVKTSSGNSKVEERDSVYFVSLRSKPHNNCANLELIDTLARYFNVSKSSVNISHGLKGKKKLVNVDT